MEKIFYENIEKNTIGNSDYRRVVYTGKMQFVYMNIEPMDNIHKEIHDSHDQFIRVESGEGEAILNNTIYKLYDGIGIIIPAGITHEIKNTNKDLPLKLYTIYSPAEHKANTLEKRNPDKNSADNTDNFYKSKYLKYKKKYLASKKI
jgi:mannose-6-phosphate isomerase-like protein (cupin superfamily)